MQYVIHRRTDQRFERGVLITDSNGGRHSIDPQDMVREATGVLYNRYHCILSFAHGLQTSGHAVRFQIRRADGSAQSQSVCLNEAVPIYHFAGMAWGMEAWLRLLITMNTHIIANRRASVYTRTAEHYFPSFRWPSFAAETLRWII